MNENKIKLWLSIFFFSNIFASNYLILNVYENVNETNFTGSDIRSINMLFSEQFEQYGDVEISSISCNNNNCALSELSKTNNDYVVYTKLMKLGSKIIYTGHIINEESNFTSKVTALSIEDMENAIARLAKSLVLNESIQDVADIDNIMENEEKEDRRRQSLGRVGFSVGYMFPTFNSYTGINYDENYNSETHDYDHTISTVRNVQKIVLGANYLYEFKENIALLAEFLFYTGSPFSFGADMSLLKYLGKDDFSPYIGGGLGLHWVSYCSGYNCEDELNMPPTHRRSGLALNGQAGYILFRTYNVNVIARAKYHLVLNTELDQGFGIDIGLERKPSPRRIAEESKTYGKWYLYLIGFSLLMSMVD